MAVDSRTGTRVEPKDSYSFVRGTTAVFKFTFASGNKPIDVDAGTNPVAKVLEPAFLNTQLPTQGVVATLIGEKVPGTLYEYQFAWAVPVDMPPDDNYVVQYEGFIGGRNYVATDEFFNIAVSPEAISGFDYGYCTIQDIRLMKANIDSYFPKSLANDINARNEIIRFHIKNSTDKLREELNLVQSRGFSANNRLFAIYFTIWSILNSAHGEDGSAVSIERLEHWEKLWTKILEQAKRRSLGMGISYGRG